MADRKTALAAALAGCVLAVCASSAGAADLCVGATGSGAPTCSGGNSFSGDAAGLQAAITASQVAPGSNDKIYLASGTYASAHGWSLGSGNDVDLIGVGASKPQLTNSLPASSDATLSSSGGSVTISNLAVVAGAAVNAAGISTNLGSPTIQDVDISGPGATDSVGILVQGQGATIERATIDLPYASAPAIGIRAVGAASLAVADVNVTNASQGLDLTTGTNNVNIERVRVTAPFGIAFTDSWGTVSSSLLITPPSGTPGMSSTTAVGVTVDDGTAYALKPVNLFNDTIAGNGVTTGQAIATTATNAGSSSNVIVNSTVATGHVNAFLLTGGSGGVPNINVDYSRWTGNANGATLLAHASALAGDPAAGFSNPAGGDYTLQKTSPLVDAGDPGALSGSATDLAGNPRQASRGAGIVRDIGAYEQPNTTPVARIAIVSVRPVTTAPTIFSAAGSSDADGDALTYAWKFDGNLFSNGQTVSRTLVADGPHTVQLTVTDATGAADTIAQQYIVEKGTFKIALNKKPLRANAKGKFKFPLSCPDTAANDCSGKLLFKTTGRKAFKAGQYVFSVEPGTTRSLPITPTPSFRKLLKHSKSVKLKASLTGSTGNAWLAGAATSFKLSLAK